MRPVKNVFDERNRKKKYIGGKQKIVQPIFFLNEEKNNCYKEALNCCKKEDGRPGIK